METGELSWVLGEISKVLTQCSAGEHLCQNASMPIKPCLRVPCPKCGAKAGDQCLLVGKFAGQSSTMCHDERVAAAKPISKEDASQAAARIVREATEGK